MIEKIKNTLKQSKNQKAADLINELMAQIGNALEDYGKDGQE